jgi:hypothetical protein
MADTLEKTEQKKTQEEFIQSLQSEDEDNELLKFIEIDFDDCSF